MVTNLIGYIFFQISNLAQIFFQKAKKNNYGPSGNVISSTWVPDNTSQRNVCLIYNWTEANSFFFINKFFIKGHNSNINNFINNMTNKMEPKSPKKTVEETVVHITSKLNIETFVAHIQV